MAKAKKLDTGSTANKKKAGKVKVDAPQEAPLVDTNLAAEAAAKRVVAGLGPVGTAPAISIPQSTGFKNFKDSLNKPAAGSLGGILDRTAGPGQRKPNLPFHGGKQTGRNQTFGADVNRTGVPRRTGGG